MAGGLVRRTALAGRRLLLVEALLLLGAAACSSKNTTPAPPTAAGVASTGASTPVGQIAAPVGSASPLVRATVTASTLTVAPLAARTPLPVVLITAREYAFDGPTTLPAGTPTFMVTNAGTQVHEMAVVRLTGGTGEQLQTAFAVASATPPSYTALPGVAALPPSASGAVTLNLTPGTYGLLCFIGDPQTGKSHAQLGMVSAFTVE